MKKNNEVKLDELIIEDITDSAPDLIEEPSEDTPSKPRKKKKKSKKKKHEAKEAITPEAPKEETVKEPEKEQAEEPTEKIPEESEEISETPEEVSEEILEASEDPAVESNEDKSEAETEEEKVTVEVASTDENDTAAGDDSDIVIDMHGIIKRYFIGQPNELEVLHGIDMKVRRGEFVAVVGQSGSGKSTLMNMIGALDRPTEGQYFLDGVDMFAAKDKDLSAIRCKKIGFVFQTYNLVARTSALKNVELPMLYAGMSMSKRSKRAKELLAMVEMEDRMRHQPDELSGGQKQRVAIARAMANDPAIILADEPTGALDSMTGRLIMDIFHRLHDEQGKTIILITHSPELADECERILTLKDGNIINERKGSGKVAVL